MVQIKTMPMPKCPDHTVVFMEYRDGEFPHRVTYCPACNDHWIECGYYYGQVELKRMFRRG
jgi:hypothetical protein